MRRAVMHDAVLLSAFVLFTGVVLVGDSSPWIALVGALLVALQALRLIERIAHLWQRGANAPR